MIRARLEHHWPGFSLRVNFESKGPVLGIFGPSGSGKSSLLQLLAGWIHPNGLAGKAHDKDTQPNLEIIGVPLIAAGQKPVPIEKRGLALVPQDSLLFPHRNTRDNLAFSPGGPERLASARGQRILEWLRLGSLLDRRTDTLSGGERQRVALGRAWLAEPRLVLLDEPAASLDPELAQEVIALLAEAKQEWGIPMVFVTHRSSELLALADDCLHLQGGQVVAQGPPLEVLAQAGRGAQWSGVENLLHLTVLDHDPQAGISRLDLGQGQCLAVPLLEQAAGMRVHICLSGEDILVAQGSPGPTSARNELRAHLGAMTPVGGEVLLDLLVGETNLQARVTPGACEALGLRSGQAIHLLIKSTACRLL